MEKTIKGDLNRKIVYSKLINDNTLLEYYVKGDILFITVRFVDLSSVREHVLKTIPVEESDNIFQIVNFNEDNSAIAIFNKTDEGYQLNGVYDTIEHSYEASDFMDIVYEKKFNQKLGKRLIKKEDFNE